MYNVKTTLDDFEDASLGAMWETGGAPSYTEGDGVLTVHVPAAVGEKRYFQTNTGNVDLAGGKYYGMELVDAGNVATSGTLMVAPIRIFPSNNTGRAFWRIKLEGGTCSAQPWADAGGFSPFGTSFVYNPAVHRFFAIGLGPSGDVEWLWSTDGVVWNVHFAMANPWGVTTFYHFGAEIGHDSGAAYTASDVALDNFMFLVGQEVMEVVASEDTMVAEVNPTFVYGATDQISARSAGSGSEIESYMRFSIPAAPAGMALAGATIRLTTSNDPTANSTGAHQISLMTGTWDEDTTTWNNRPTTGFGAQIGELTGATALNTPYEAELDAEPLIPYVGTSVALALRSTSTDNVRFLSKDQVDLDARPTLILTYAAAPPAPPGPTFVAKYESAWDTESSPKTAAVTVVDGAVLVLVAAAENGLVTVNTPTMAGVTWTLEEVYDNGLGGFPAAWVWSGVATQSGTFTLSVTATTDEGSLHWGFNCLRFANAGGVGSSVQFYGNPSSRPVPSVDITTTQDSSTLVTVISDWNAVDGSSRAWLQVNGADATEQTYAFESGVYTVCAASWADAGPAGNKTVGLSAPSNLDYAILAVEVLAAQPDGGVAGNAELDLSVAITTAGVIGKASTAELSASVSLTGEGGAALGPNKPASMPIAVSITSTHRKDTSGAASRSLSVAINATGSIGKSAAASLNLDVDAASAGVSSRSGSAALATTVAIAAEATASKGGPVSLSNTVAITATAYIASGAGTSIRWLRINGAWVQVPPAA